MRVALLAGLIAVAATLALAHSAVDATAPENGAELAQAPAHIVLTFTKRIRLTRVRMTHDAGDAIDLDLGEQKEFGTRFELPLKDMGSGIYRIEWRGLSGDGHTVRNTFGFRVK